MGNCLRPQRAATWADGNEWQEEAEVCSRAAAAAAAVEEKKVEVKIRVTRRQLQELLEKAGCGGGLGDGGKAKRRQVEEVLAELMTSGRVCYQQEMRRHWRPALYSIPEAADES